MLRAFGVAISMLTLSPLAAAQTPPLYVNDHYDVRADPYQDLERALDRASAESKRILIVVGGDWCVWCEILDLYLARNTDVRAEFARSFVVLKVNLSRQNENTAFLSGFPRASGFPHFFILDSNGAYLGQQNTGELENGRGYDRGRMLAFAARWR